MEKPNSVYLKKIRLCWAVFYMGIGVVFISINLLRGYGSSLARPVYLFLLSLITVVVLGGIFAMIFLIVRFSKKGKEEYAVHYFGTTDTGKQDEIMANIRNEILELSGKEELPQELEAMYNNTYKGGFWRISKLTSLNSELEKIKSSNKISE